jgi:hypothetical protein
VEQHHWDAQNHSVSNFRTLIALQSYAGFGLNRKDMGRDKMKKEKAKSDKKKAQYRKPVLTKHKKLRDITAGTFTTT